MNVLSENRKLNICIITNPFENIQGSYFSILKNFLTIVTPIINEIHIISGNLPESSIKIENSTIHNIITPKIKDNDLIIRFINRFFIEIQLSLSLIKIRKQFRGPIFIFSATLLLPIIASKIIQKKSILTAVASESTNIKMTHTNPSISFVYLDFRMVRFLENLCYMLSDKIIVESPNVSIVLGLEKRYSHKILGRGPLFILDKSFYPMTNHIDRPVDLGYIGRFSEEKGIQNFIHAALLTLKKRKDYHILIGGDGPLKESILQMLHQKDLNSAFEFAGWISHDDLPKYLNNLHLLVLPSYTEGLPNIMLEAMACGTPVLATSVGGIPDIIKDGKTGFIMENNSPECIAKNVIRALNHPNLDKIAENAHDLVRKEYTYEAAVERYKKILDEL